jgi:sterol desaturase/sphingolipid hydroxylase (fatty acid hydroxylase superfamily)
MSPFDLIADLGLEAARYMAGFFQREGAYVLGLLFNPGSQISLPSLLSALAIAVLAASLRRKGKRIPRIRVWLRAIFPRRIVRADSTKADFGFLLLNIFAIGGLIGWAMLAAGQVGEAVKHGLTATFGAPAATSLPGPVVATVATLALFLAYEVAYWLDHYTSHKIPFFWAFHKAHHTAEVLTPLTSFRVHPIDTLKFGNISAVIIGAMSGLLAWGFGGQATGYTINGTNLVLIAFIFTLAHLQHSHVWIASTGMWSRILLSPAHHQIHHSDNPIHFDRNFGSALAVWDWMFGTLHAPKAQRENIVFGVGCPVDRPHSVTGTLITPFIEAVGSLKPASRPAIVPAE